MVINQQITIATMQIQVSSLFLKKIWKMTNLAQIALHQQWGFIFRLIMVANESHTNWEEQHPEHYPQCSSKKKKTIQRCSWIPCRSKIMLASWRIIYLKVIKSIHWLRVHNFKKKAIILMDKYFSKHQTPNMKTQTDFKIIRLKELQKTSIKFLIYQTPKIYHTSRFHRATSKSTRQMLQWPQEMTELWTYSLKIINKITERSKTQGGLGNWGYQAALVRIHTVISNQINQKINKQDMKLNLNKIPAYKIKVSRFRLKEARKYFNNKLNRMTTHHYDKFKDPLLYSKQKTSPLKETPSQQERKLSSRQSPQSQPF